MKKSPILTAAIALILIVEIVVILLVCKEIGAELKPYPMDIDYN